MKKIEMIFNKLLFLQKKRGRGISAMELSQALGLDRANVSRYLNQLHEEGKVEKQEGRPVRFLAREGESQVTEGKDIGNSLESIVGARQSLQVVIQQAKAAMMYPPRGLHTILLGETGVGKSMFAELMYRFALESGVLKQDAPFIQFNCADYSENPQLLTAQIFGVKKGTFTGADRDREGLMKKAHGGILFLDEVHRLPPQGQEILFMYIDKGCLRPLGDTTEAIRVEVQLIAATTEDPRSSLLKTFLRRIPMTITLPSLAERSLIERYQLTEVFIKEESERIGKSIYINKNVMASFLLYECSGNIGQLRSDIQLACAKAFLTYKTQNKDYIIINQVDLPHHVKKGLMKIQEYRREIENIMTGQGDMLRFHHQQGLDMEIKEKPQGDGDFYEVIEKKLETLKRTGLEENEINQILNIDIESHFQKYLGKLTTNFNREELSKVVDESIVEVVEAIFALARERLNRVYDEKIYYGLALHLSGSIKRIKGGHKIYHPKLNFIRVNYVEEFLVAMEATKLIDQRFEIETPLDEIGYLAMFFASDPYDIHEEEPAQVGILVLMHGSATASSMVEVANQLVGANHAKALDMPLKMKPAVMYELAKKEVIALDQGKGVLMLVDMGSLTNFGAMIQEETGIETETIDMVSTPVVIDACRKAALGQTLGEICDSLRDHIPREHREKAVSNTIKRIIITACFTGEGAAARLKEMIADTVGNTPNFEIIPLNLLDKGAFTRKLNQLRRQHRIVAVVGTLEIKSQVPFISAGDILTGKGIQQLKGLIEQEKTYMNIADSLKDHIGCVEVNQLVKDSLETVEALEVILGAPVAYEVKTGILLHICFLIDKLCRGDQETLYHNLAAYEKEHVRELTLVKKALGALEKQYKIRIGENETAYICHMFLANQPEGRV